MRDALFCLVIVIVVICQFGRPGRLVARSRWKHLASSRALTRRGTLTL